MKPNKAKKKANQRALAVMAKRKPGKKAAKPVDVYAAMVRSAHDSAMATDEQFFQGIAFELILAALIDEKQAASRKLDRALGLTSEPGDTMTFNLSNGPHSGRGLRHPNRKGKQ